VGRRAGGGGGEGVGRRARGGGGEGVGRRAGGGGVQREGVGRHECCGDRGGEEGSHFSRG
jgi:hypothetical protein